MTPRKSTPLTRNRTSLDTLLRFSSPNLTPIRVNSGYLTWNPVPISSLHYVILHVFDHPLRIILSLPASNYGRIRPDMKSARKDGLYLLLIGAAIFVLVSLALEYRPGESSVDFKAVYSSSQCVFEHCDPYELSGAAVYPPTTYIVTAPLGLLPWERAQVLWAIVTGAVLILASLLMWSCGAQYAPLLSGGQLGLLLASGAIFIGNGNPAGLAIGLCTIGVWCFLNERFVLAGILCVAISLAIKPHDTGLVWLCFLLLRGTHRKRALQTLAAIAVLVLAATLWISYTAPHWLPELRSNLAAMNVHGGNNDPGPDGITAEGKTLYPILSLSAIVSVFRDDPNIYNPISYLVSATLLLVWAITAARSRARADAWRSESPSIVDLAVLPVGYG